MLDGLSAIALLGSLRSNDANANDAMRDEVVAMYLFMNTAVADNESPFSYDLSRFMCTHDISWKSRHHRSFPESR